MTTTDPVVATVAPDASVSAGKLAPQASPSGSFGNRPPAFLLLGTLPQMSA